MSPTDEQLQTLVERCEQFRDSKPPKGYRQGLALCIVDSVQSTGVTYSSVLNVVDSYRRYRKAQHADPETDGVRELSATFDELGGPDVWAREIGNQNKTSTHKGAPLKAAAIRDAVKVFLAEGITASQDLRDAAVDPERLAQIESAWLRILGQPNCGLTSGPQCRTPPPWITSRHGPPHHQKPDHLVVMGPEQKCRRDCPCNWTTNDDHLWRELHEDYRQNNGESYL